ncbi:MAG: NAD(P)/FAD-dependent oxidoreductase [Rhodospirillales bacterium]|nr:NAD(P)/FAD-dependent oxidoreductase [Rhodospirillales bacterium]
MSSNRELGDPYELVVVGAGPAGLAAATAAAGLGINTVLLDEQSSLGGQIYRAIEETPLADPAVLGKSYGRGRLLVRSFVASGARHIPGASVWHVAEGQGGCLTVGLSVGSAAHMIEARRVILATGALERPFPIPGWTLPGVLAAGGAQTLLKSAAIVPAGYVVLAGTGPLLWLFAAQMLRAGGRITAFLDTASVENRRAALAHLPGFLASSYFREGLDLMRAVRRGAQVVRGVKALVAHGTERLSEVAFRRLGSTEERIPADILLLHQGVVPDLNLAAAAGCKLTWDERQLAFLPVTDRWGASSVEGIAIAGDGAGIMGSEAAAERGRLAALDAACRLGRITQSDRDRKAAPVAKALARATRGRAFLDALFRPTRAFRVPEGETIVCRCEEVTARQVRESAAFGCPGPNQLKAFLRAGMGPCQGRMCGLTVSALLAEARGVTMGEIGYFRLRPPVKPLTLSELAALPATPAAMEAVGR